MIHYIEILQINSHWYPDDDGKAWNGQTYGSNVVNLDKQYKYKCMVSNNELNSKYYTWNIKTLSKLSTKHAYQDTDAQPMV